MKKISIYSNAKINFGLYITGKRADGFHSIETLFYPIRLRDTITFEIAESFSFTTGHPVLLDELEHNLIVKAVRLLEQETGKPIPAKIHLDKVTPLGAGLGGGSSNAAITLLSLNELFKLQIKKEDIAKLALLLGSDVPFFLHPQPAIGKGRGEILERIEFEIRKPILIVNPGIHVSTKWAYENCKPGMPEINLHEVIRQETVDYAVYNGVIKNDFERVVFRVFPEIKELKEKLLSLGAEFALMSGSGSTVFGIFPNLESAEAASRQLPNRYFRFIDTDTEEE